LANGIIRKTIGGDRIAHHALMLRPPIAPAGMHVDELLNAREKINKAVLTEMVFCNEQWGIEVVSYEGA
jgi:hypothetical protein